MKGKSIEKSCHRFEQMKVFDLSIHVSTIYDWGIFFPPVSSSLKKEPGFSNTMRWKYSFNWKLKYFEKEKMQKHNAGGFGVEVKEKLQPILHISNYVNSIKSVKWNCF